MYLIYNEIPELLQLLPRELWLIIQKQLFTNNLMTITDKLRFPQFGRRYLGFRGYVYTYTLYVCGSRNHFEWWSYTSETYSMYSRYFFV